MLQWHLNVRQISHRFTSSFVNPSFQYLNDSHIVYWNMIILNLSRFKVEPHSKYWYICIERWDLLSLRFSENAVLFQIEWVCLKTAGNVNRPPYRFTAVTHWACPPSPDFITPICSLCPHWPLLPMCGTAAPKGHNWQFCQNWVITTNRSRMTISTHWNCQMHQFTILNPEKSRLKSDFYVQANGSQAH